MMKNKIKNKIITQLDIKYINISDLTDKHKNHIQYDGGGHYKLIVVSDDFKNYTLIQRHQLIYKILKNMIKKEIHAISIETKTVEEYKNSKNN